jgi:hypothetical protein
LPSAEKRASRSLNGVFKDDIECAANHLGDSDSGAVRELRRLLSARGNGCGGILAGDGQASLPLWMYDWTDPLAKRSFRAVAEPSILASQIPPPGQEAV